MERAAKDYGVVIEALDPDLDDYRLDEDASRSLRERLRDERTALLESDPEDVARRYREGELDVLDLVRQYAVIVDWGTGELLPKTTAQYRESLRQRSSASWS